MDPRLLQRQIRDNANDLESFCKDLKQWRIDMNRKETANQKMEGRKTSSSRNKPPTEVDSLSKASSSSDFEAGTSTSTTSTSGFTANTSVSSASTSISTENVPFKEKCTKSERKPKRTSTVDYSVWEKFDADAECAKLDENSSDDSYLTDECDNSSIDNANVEKEKGNEFVKKQMWDKAIKCYTTAIKLYNYDPIFYANRALCHLKKNNFQACEEDCNKAIRLDSAYVKAYQRRASARENLNLISEAHSDLQTVLKLEPKNKESKLALSRIEKKLEDINKVKSSSEEVQRPKSKFTMSRQQKEQVVPPTSKLPDNKMALKEDEPIKLHVIERKTKPEVDEQLAIEKQKPVPSTSQAEVLEKQEKPAKVKSAWSDEGDIELVQTIYKKPNERSKMKLIKAEVLDVDEFEDISSDLPAEPLGKKLKIDKPSEEPLVEKIADRPKPSNVDNLKNMKNQENLTTSNISIKEGSKQIIEDSIEKINEELDNSLAVPKTAVQFCNHWKTMTDSVDLRIQYLSKIRPADLADIFKESLSCRLFSEIIATLASDEKRVLSAYNYLMGLTQVPRFGAMTMFMSRDDKKCLFTIIDFMREDKTLNQEDVDVLIKKYEL